VRVETSQVLFRNVRVFPGYGDVLLAAQDVTIDDRTIASVAPHDPAGSVGDDVTVIDGANRTLIVKDGVVLKNRS
jgi:N-acyl-D-aspartate/D-glutamate deacylase